MFQLKRKKASLLGIDISSTSVKVVELSQTDAGYRIESLAVEPLPANAVAEKNIQDVEAVGESLIRALKKSGTKCKLTALAVPGSSVITKTITMPASLSDSDLESQIELEADQYIPYPLEEINLDFQVLGETKGNPDTVDVLLAASRSENVEMRTAVAEIAGLTPKLVDVEAYTIEKATRLFTPKPDKAEQSEDTEQTSEENTRPFVIAVLDVGATMTSLNVIENNELIYTREQTFGGKQLTEEIMRRYGLAYEEAGRLKKTGGLPDNYIPEVLEPFKENMAQQVSRFLQFFYTAGQHESVDMIALAGGCASIPGIDEVVSSQLGIETIIANPFAEMDLSNKVNAQALNNDAPALLIACGLAMRSFD